LNFSNGRFVSKLTVTFENVTWRQAFGQWFIMVHDPSVPSPFAFNTPASQSVGLLCELGDPSVLVATYEGMEGVTSVTVIPNNLAFLGPNPAGDRPFVEPLATSPLLPVDLDVPVGQVVTVGAMMNQSNDGCVVLNAQTLYPGTTYPLLDMDAGTKGNIETCTSTGGIFGRGPCQGLVIEDFAFNEGREGAEGFITTHRGIGATNPDFAHLDWRGPQVYAHVTHRGFDF
jgi:hypothetical protein